MVKHYWKASLLALLSSLCLLFGQVVWASNAYSHLFVKITDATTAVRQDDQETAQQLLAELQAEFAALEGHDSKAGKKVSQALAIEGEIEEQDLVAVSKALMAFDAEQHPVDVDAEKTKLLVKLTPQYEDFQAALDSQDIAVVKLAYKQFNTVWTRNEGIVRTHPAHYGRVETGISFLRSAIETEPVDFAAIQSNFDTTKAAIQSFVDGEAIEDTTQKGLTLTDGINLLEKALTEFQAGNTKEGQATMREFVTIWPGIEGDISTRDNALYTRVESESPVIMVKGAEAAYQEKLQALITDLSAIDTSAAYTFLDAALILLREGVEALLIVLALVSSLRASKHKKGLSWIYGGAIAGILGSVVMAILLQSLFPAVASATNREILEGAVGIFAVVMMLFVGIWLHSKSSVKKWNAFMEKQMEQVLKTGSFITMFAVSFLAVFREGAETILFYVGMLPRIEVNQLLLGMFLAILLLIVIAIVLLKMTDYVVAYKVFFYITWLIYGLAFKMLGVSIHALQLTDILPSHLVPSLPTIDWIGFYPTLEVLLPQLIFILVIVFVSIKQRDTHG